MNDSGSVNYKPYFNPFEKPIEGDKPADNGEGAATLEATKEDVGQMQEKAVSTPVKLSDEKNADKVPTNKNALPEGTSDNIPTKKSVGLLGTLWSSVNSVKSINKTFGETIPGKITHMSLGKMLGNAISSVSNFNMKETQSSGKAEKSQGPKKGAEGIGVKSEGEESVIEHDEETFAALKNEVLEMLGSAEDPSRCELSPQQWVAFAKADPTAAGKLLYDQSNPPPGLTPLYPVKAGEATNPKMEQILQKLSAKFDPQLPGQKLTSNELSKVISGALAREIEQHQHAGNALRGASVGNTLLKAFTEAYVKPAFDESKAMKSFMKSIPTENFRDKDDETKLGDGQEEKMEKSFKNYFNAASEFLLNNNSEEMKAYREIISGVSNEIEAKWPGEGKKAGVNIAVLRFLNVQLSTPGFYEKNTAQHKNALLVVKGTQNMFNAATSSATAGMKMDEPYKVSVNAIADRNLSLSNDLQDKIMR